MSKRSGSRYVSGRSSDWIKLKNRDSPAVKREAEEDWGRRGGIAAATQPNGTTAGIFTGENRGFTVGGILAP